MGQAHLIGEYILGILLACSRSILDWGMVSDSRQDRTPAPPLSTGTPDAGVLVQPNSGTPVSAFVQFPVSWEQLP